MAKSTPVKSKVKKEKVVLKKEKPIAKVLHYYDKIKVAVLKLFSELKVGDEIRIVGGENTDFQQKVDSMQIDHKPLKKAKKGQEVGLKIKKQVREGYKVFKV
ncbi:MAG: hypothetical protein AUJ25_01105 [Parcubacteria group bacterium CG1_02_37_13]|nr:MAG: hypothetical protein AUJ25_01105 [Parcubacteria group bacterium CG1_02_37_13]